MKHFKVCDPVILHERVDAPRPEPGAHDVTPSPKGEEYSFTVDHYWRVARVLDDGSLELLSAEGKLVRVAPDDPRLEKPGWVRRLLRQNRFPEMAHPAA